MSTQQQVDPMEQYELPKQILLRVSKQVLPDNIQIQKEAKQALSKASLLFINYLTAKYYWLMVAV